MKIKESVVSGQKSVAGRRFARSKNAQKARQRLECVCFSTAFRNPCPLMSISGWKSWCLGVFVVKTGSKNSNHLRVFTGKDSHLQAPLPPGVFLGEIGDGSWQMAEAGSQKQKCLFSLNFPVTLCHAKSRHITPCHGYSER